MTLKQHAGEGVAEAREYVEAQLGLQCGHSLYRQAMTDPTPIRSRTNTTDA